MTSIQSVCLSRWRPILVAMAFGVAVPASAEGNGASGESRVALTTQTEAKPSAQSGMTTNRRGSRPPACYRIVVERHATLCKQFARNLNMFCSEPLMRCGVKLHPSMQHLFLEPKWEPIDPVENFDRVGMVYRAQTFMRTGSPGSAEDHAYRQKKWAEWRDEVRAKAEAGRLKLSRATFDHTNQRRYGLPASQFERVVYRVDDPDCAESPRYSDRARRAPSPLFAVIDPASGEASDSFGHVYQSILYKGGYNYFSRWVGSRGAELELTEPAALRPLCEFTYDTEEHLK